MTLKYKRNQLILFKVIKIPLLHPETQNLDKFPMLCLFSVSLIGNSASQWATLFVMQKQSTNPSAPAPGEPSAVSKSIFTQKIIINLPKPQIHLLHMKKKKVVMLSNTELIQYCNQFGNDFQITCQILDTSTLNFWAQPV